MRKGSVIFRKLPKYPFGTEPIAVAQQLRVLPLAGNNLSSCHMRKAIDSGSPPIDRWIMGRILNLCESFGSRRTNFN